MLESRQHISERDKEICLGRISWLLDRAPCWQNINAFRHQGWKLSVITRPSQHLVTFIHAMEYIAQAIGEQATFQMHAFIE